jgi:hypothetical protein
VDIKIIKVGMKILVQNFTLRGSQVRFGEDIKIITNTEEVKPERGGADIKIIASTQEVKPDKGGYQDYYILLLFEKSSRIRGAMNIVSQYRRGRYQDY